MQIRVATRQDEPRIAEIVFQSLEACGIQPDPDGLDRDLKNMEHNYFWYDGLSIVAEAEGKILGVLAARRREGEEEILELCRLAVAPEARRQGAATALAKTMLFFAGNLEYKRIVSSLPARSGESRLWNEEAMQALGFRQDDTGVFAIDVPRSPVSKDAATLSSHQ
jgi:predicted N-acetyltransferase YhbS